MREFDEAEELRRDAKVRAFAEKKLPLFFKEHREIEQADAYNRNVSIFPDLKKTMSHWAFYEVLDKLEEEGKIRKEPITKVVGYKIFWQEDEEDQIDHQRR